jgi:hypothetical protein
MDTPERRVWGERRPKDRVTLQIILVFTLTCPKHLSVFDKYLHWISVSVKKYTVNLLYNHAHVSHIFVCVTHFFGNCLFY